MSEAWSTQGTGEKSIQHSIPKTSREDFIRWRLRRKCMFKAKDFDVVDWIHLSQV